jgi:hypothetical protein
MSTRYREWLQSQGVRLFYGGGIYWRFYRGALIPASIVPCFINLDNNEAKGLLSESGVPFIRYSSGPSAEPTDWWYIVCDTYDTAKLSSKMRNQIKRGYKTYTVDRIGCGWLARHGYDCYLSAFSRYTHGQPVTEKEFREQLLDMQWGPFEHWGVFQGDHLVGYGQCIVEDSDVLIDVAKFTPEHLRNYCAYALYDRVLRYYVSDSNLRVNDGNRPISHDTDMHENLLKYGFRKLYGFLNVVYQPWLRWVLSASFPMRSLIIKFSTNRIFHKFHSLILQEEIRRNCLAKTINNI